jgi:hypothetical protein
MILNDKQEHASEFDQILSRYRGFDLDAELSTFERLVSFSGQFYRDVAEIYDATTRVKNVERNPTGYDFNDAAILGLLVRIWKILKEVVRYYEENKGEILSLLDRQVTEAAVIAKYLLISQASVIEDYRKCSYRDRLRILDEAQRSPELFTEPAAERLLCSIRGKLANEGWTPESFEIQKRNRWRLQNKTFYDIFAEVEPPRFYKFLYGLPSESIHGSWNDSMDYHLIRREDGTFSTYPHYQEVDIRIVTPLLRLSNDPYVLWLKRIDAFDENFKNMYAWIHKINKRLFDAFEAAYARRQAHLGIK